MKQVILIVKVTEACNLRCVYCYNSESQYKGDVLSLERFEKMLDLMGTEYQVVQVLWHGGEPLCAGLDYYKQAVEAEKRVSVRKNIQIKNSVQTNATLINDEWAKFFKKNNFNVGISFDGINNEKYRQQSDKTLKAMDILKKHGVGFGCLAVVSDDEYDLKANYRFFRDKDISIEFNAIFSEGGGKDLKSLDPVKYAQNYCDLFDEWLYDTKGVKVRSFANYIVMALDGRFRICTFCSCHTKYMSIYPDGNIYNCARAGMTAYPFGNIDTATSVQELLSSEGAVKLIKGSIERRNKCKESCELFHLCTGGCADTAITENGLENPPENHCYFFKTVYNHISQVIKGVLDAETPLDKLNPAVKAVLAENLVRTDSGNTPKLHETYTP